MTPIFTVIMRTNPEASEEAIGRDEAAITEAPSGGDPPSLLTPREVTMYSLIGFGSIFFLLIFVIFWLRSKSRSTEMLLINQEREFERDMINEFGSSASGRTASTARAQSSARSESDEQPIGPGVVSQSAAAAVAPAAPPSQQGQSSLTPAGNGAESFEALADQVCKRLDTAGLLLSREGAFLLNDSDTRGLMIKLRGDRLALIMGDWESEKFYRRQLKRFDVIFIAHNEADVTVIQTMPRYLGDHISM